MRPVLEDAAFSIPAARDAPLDRGVDNTMLDGLDRREHIDQLYR